jgi:hypothetical protein
MLTLKVAKVISAALILLDAPKLNSELKIRVKAYFFIKSGPLIQAGGKDKRLRR